MIENAAELRGRPIPNSNGERYGDDADYRNAVALWQVSCHFGRTTEFEHPKPAFPKQHKASPIMVAQGL